MTPILETLLPLVADHARKQALGFLEGGEAIGGTVDEEIVEFLHRKGVEWDGLTVAEQDQTRDAYLCSFQSEAARLFTRTETASHASSVVPAPLVPEVVKRAERAMETAVGMLRWAAQPSMKASPAKSQSWRSHADELESALTALRNYSPAPSPSVELLREARDMINGLESYASDHDSNVPPLEHDNVLHFLSKLNAALSPEVPKEVLSPEELKRRNYQAIYG